MTSNFSSQLQTFFTAPIRWVANTPVRAVEEAYKAAIEIKKMEDEYFGGKEISDLTGYSENTYSLFLTQLRKCLFTIDLRLAEYKVSSNLPYLLSNPIDQPLKPLSNDDLSRDFRTNKPSVLQQLALIDFILARYRLQPQQISNQDRSNPQAELVKLLDVDTLDRKNESDNHHKFTLFGGDQKIDVDTSQVVPIEKSILPGSFVRAVDRIRRNLTSSYNSYEQDVVGELRQSRKRTNIAIRYILVLVALTVLSQQVSKIAIYSPLVDRWNVGRKIDTQFNPEFEDEALEKFRIAKEKIEFERLVGITQMSPQESEASLKEEAINITEYYKGSSLEGVKNLFADITAVFVFYFILVMGRKQVQLVKEFIDETVYSLNDNAKAFILIATTDIFVGYHSSDGWDALLSSILRHFGLPDNRVLILTFIATVPVFLDALFKFWVFQYLRRSSPATATIYKDMNE